MGDTDVFFAPHDGRVTVAPLELALIEIMLDLPSSF